MADNVDIVIRRPTSELVLGSFAPNVRRRYKIQDDEGQSFLAYDGNERFLVKTALVRSSDYKAGKGPTIASPSVLAKLTRHLAHYDQEHMVTIALNGQSRLVAIHELSIGTSNQSMMAVGDAIKVCTMTGAVAMALVHNHPSGSSLPSDDDLRTTQAVDRACKCIGRTLVDSLIVTYTGWRSIVLDEFGDWDV